MLVYTIGHGTRTAEEFVEVLRTASVGRLVDVRRYPGSRRHPQFGRAALQRCLQANDISYEWRGDALGGRRSAPAVQTRHPALTNRGFRNFADYMGTAEFRAALQRLEQEARGRPTSALMCAETLWWRCHRRMISDALVLRGVEVSHLLDVRTSQPHRLHQSARSDEHRLPVYDVGALRPG
jgi:uncharacterized protein (DUF488 family)